MRLALVGAVVGLVVGASRAQAQPEAPVAAPVAAPPAVAAAAPTIELYTMGLGEEWIERYGHSAMCVRWPDPARDRCYNYGTTSFDRPASMVWNFLRGRSTFWVSTTTPERLIESYAGLDRSVWVQELPLAPAAARQLAVRLAHQARRENRYYHYHHYADNCTTRLRDFVDEATAGALRQGARGTFPDLRQLSRAGWAELPGLLYLSDLLLGRRIDRVPTPYEAMFLPLVLRDQVEAVLGVKPELLYERQGRVIGQDPPGRWPVVVALIGFAAPLALARWRRRFERLALGWALAPCLVLSLLIWTMVIVSPVPELRWNELVLVFMPLDLALVVGPRRWRRRYARGRVIELVVVSLARAVGLLRQPLWLFALLPLGPAAFVALDDAAEEPVAAEPVATQPAGSSPG